MKVSDNSVVNALLAHAQKMMDCGAFLDAIPYYEDGASKLGEKENPEAVGECYERIGSCCELTERWPEAFDWYCRAEEMFTRAGNDTRAKHAAGSAKYAKSQPV